MTIKEICRRKEELGYSAARLSELSGVPVGTLQKILSGETKTPRFATLAAIEKVLMAYPERERGFDGVKETSAKYQARQKNQGEYTLADYYAWPEDQRIELIDGVIYDMASPSFIHQRFLLQFVYRVKSYIDRNGGDCLPMIAPVDVRLDSDDRTMVQPDALILCDKRKIRRWGIEGAPDFVLEVLSASTRNKDLTLKLKKYLNAGVKEYWLLDPDHQRLYTYNFTEGGLPGVYPLQGNVGVELFHGELKISLDELAGLFEDIPDSEENGARNEEGTWKKDGSRKEDV